MIWEVKEWAELSPNEVENIFSLRSEVFVVEQNCPYLDADNSDQNAFHLLCYKGNKLVAYLRAFKPGVKYKGSSMGRIVTELNSRGLGIGKEITKEGVNFLKKEFPNEENYQDTKEKVQEL